jgi:hypothetical protein
VERDTEGEERYGWSTPPDPEPEPEPLSPRTLSLMEKAQPYQTEIHFKALQTLVQKCSPDTPEEQVKIDAKALETIRMKFGSVEIVKKTTNELLEYGKRKELTPAMKAWIRENLAYLAQTALAKGVKLRRSRFVMSHEPAMEMYTVDHDDNGDEKEPQCTFCIDDHEPNEYCPDLFDRGPQNAKLLVDDPLVTCCIRAIYVGSKETIYLPEQIENHCPGFDLVRNLGIIDHDKIYYPTGILKSSVAQSEPSTRLRSAILYRLTRGAKDLKVPVFVEFLRSSGSPNAHISHHLFGFMQELAFVQQHYKGPVVGVMAMPTPDDDINWDDYVEHKRKFVQDTELAEELSRVTGVSMVRLDIFEVPVEIETPSTWFYRQLSWRRESLFGGNYLEVKTREYQRRFGMELGSWIKDLDSVDYQGIWDKYLDI